MFKYFKIWQATLFSVLVLGYITIWADIIDPSIQELFTSGNQIVTSTGTPIRLQAVNWFGLESDIFAPHGLWGTRNYKSMLDQIKTLGFNTIRLPFSNQLFDAASKPNGINFWQNKDLENLAGLEILDKIIEYAGSIGLRVILDHHRSNAGASAQENGLWYDDGYPESRVIADWRMLAKRYENNKTVIGADIHNEPHGQATWGSGDIKTDWHAAAERIGNAILEVNPKWLIIVEGIENYKGQNYWWGGNLMGARDFPVKLSIQNKLVYSPHDYPNSVFAQPWFSDANYSENLPAKFNEMWGYLFEDNIAPIWIGEFGSKLTDAKDISWMKKITSYLNGDFSQTSNKNLGTGKAGISWSWWSWNPNSGDTGGILLDDWQTPDANKLNYLKPLFTTISVAGQETAHKPGQDSKHLVSLAENLTALESRIK